MKRLRNCLEEVSHEKKINCSQASIPKKKEKVHGRDESRCCRFLYLEKEVSFSPKEDWPEAHTLIRIRSERKIRSTGVTSTETRYISSTKKSAKELNEKVRDHIENKPHWSLDVSMNEDGDKKWAEESAQANGFESFEKRTHQKKHQKKAKDGCHG